MARYTTQSWSDGSGGGTPVSAARLAVIEAGVKSVDYRAAVRVFHNANQSIANSSLTALAFNSERFDQENNAASTMHDTVTNNSRLTAKTAGVFLIIGHFTWAANATGTRVVQLRLNGTTVIDEEREAPGNSTDNFNQRISTVYALAVNDYVEMMVLQASGGALNVNVNANYSPEFSMVLVA